MEIGLIQMVGPLPTIVPCLIGDGALNNFPNVAALHGFISADMPFQSPGILSDTLSWQLTAFLLRQKRTLGWSE